MKIDNNNMGEAFKLMGDGAELIDRFGHKFNMEKLTNGSSHPSFTTPFKVLPHYAWAIKKVEEIFDKDTATLYVKWLEGAEIEVNLGSEWVVALNASDITYIFEWFVNDEDIKFRLKQPEKFKCRETNCWAYGVEDKPLKFETNGLPTDRYPFKATKEEALEFEKLRKQLAIKFEFLKQHAPDYKPDWSKPHTKFYPAYDNARKKWILRHANVGDCGTIHMPEGIGGKFCEMANAGLIDGLDP